MVQNPDKFSRTGVGLSIQQWKIFHQIPTKFKNKRNNEIFHRFQSLKFLSMNKI
ncbi:MAG: hypothetical protein LBT66_07830 [Methanobrevibacter sp.]|nr:hypothetical protein [Candidatus Methanovirga meridionalis]